MAGFTAQLIDRREYFINTSIKPFVPKDPQQLTFFDLPAQPADAPLFSHPKLPQQIIDEALCVGANDEHSRLIICAYFINWTFPVITRQRIRLERPLTSVEWSAQRIGR